jgi:uncharacterized membrane protein YphA (DoxX/SURF4 family)
MSGWLRDPRLVRVCQIGIGLVFGLAALGKLGDLRAFAEQVHNFRIVPIATENLVALSLPWVELVASLGLVLGIRARPAAVLVTALLAAFTVAVALAVARGLDFECGCFGTGDGSRVGLAKIAQNLALLAMAAISTLRARSTAG